MQDIGDTNEDFTAMVEAAQALAAAESVDVVNEAAAFTLGLGPSRTAGHVQPGAADVTDSLSGVSVSEALPMADMPMDPADCPPGMGMGY